MNARQISSRLAERWSLHLDFIRSSLALDPQAPQAWRWQIRERVLTYLLTRYGADPTLDWTQIAPRSAPAPVPPLERKTVEPRPASLLGTHLHRIAEANSVPLADRGLLEREFHRRSAHRVTRASVLTVVAVGIGAGALTLVVGPLLSCAAAWLLTRK